MEKPLAIWKQLLVILVLGGIGFGVWHERERVTQLTGISFGQESGEGERRGRRGRDSGGVPVIVEPVEQVQAVDRIQAIGSGLANRSITVYPDVTGVIAEIDFEAGDRVEAGDVVVKLDDAQARIAVNIAETKLADARRTLERSETLLTRNAIAQATVDTARTAVQTARLELEQARESLADRTIRAPFGGVLGIPQVELGDRVSETTPIASLDDRSIIIVEFDVPEIYLGRLQIGQPITAANAGFRGQTFKGTITEINSRIDTGTRAVRVRAALENPGDTLRGGMSFTVNLVLKGETYPAIAELALIWERDGAYVWVVNEGKAEQVKVAVVKRADGRILVDGDLKQDQLVVVEGTQRLRPGRDVSFDRPTQTAEGEAGL